MTTCSRALAPLLLMLAIGPQPVAFAFPGADQQLTPRTPAKRVRGLRLDGFRVELESTTLQAVVSHIGKGKIVRGTGKESAVRQLCYLIGSPSGKVTLLFESSALGGPEAEVTGFKMVRGRLPGATCTGIAVPMEQIVLDHDVRLGMTATALRARLEPTTSRHEGNDLVFDGTADIPGPGEYSSYHGLRARMVKNRVQRIHVWQVTSS